MQDSKARTEAVGLLILYVGGNPTSVCRDSLLYTNFYENRTFEATISMVTKERKQIEPIITSTRWKLKEAGYIGALVVGKDAKELRECIKNTFVG